MAFNLNGFRSNLKFDGARPNLFEVSMTPPGFAGGPGFSGNVLESTNPFSFLCNAAQLPGSTIGIAPTYYFGREVKLAGNRTFADWTVTILNDEDFIIRNMMEKWMDGLGSNATNLRSGNARNLSEYSAFADVKQYGKIATGRDSGTVIKSYRLAGMFPIDISPIDLAWSSNDQLEEFQVTFALQHWESATSIAS
jgi:hypothetical protein